MSEEALDLSNDIINSNMIMNRIENNRSRMIVPRKDYRCPDNVFSTKSMTAVKESMMQYTMAHQNSMASCIDDGNVSISSGNMSLNDGNCKSQEKMAEYLVHAYQEQHHQHQLGQLQTILSSLLTSSPNNVMAPWLSTKTALSSILHQLPAPTTSTLLSFTSLHSLYANIQSTCISLDKLLEQYFILFITAFLKSSQDKTLLPPLLLGSHSDTSKGSLKRKASSPLLHPSSSPTPIDFNTDNNPSSYTSLQSDNANISSYLHNNNNSRLFKRKKIVQNGNKKSNFRGTSEAENEIDMSFLPREINGEVVLCEEYMNVRLDKEVYNTLTSKAPRSATRLIRLLMKHFFSQDTLARSSLSGEGIYKDRLKPEVIESIKIFIKRRHPKLKNGSINLCMTDVCVQARRVNKNQRTRLPSSFELNSKGADSVTSGGYSPTVFSNNGLDNGYNLLNPKSDSPESAINSTCSSGRQLLGCQSPFRPLSTSKISSD